MDFKARQNKVRSQLFKAKLDFLFVSHLPNIRYLSGFTGSAGFLVVGQSGIVFFSDVRYNTQAHEEVKGARVVIASSAVLSAVGNWLTKQKKKSRKFAVGIEADHLTVSEKKKLSDLLPTGIT